MPKLEHTLIDSCVVVGMNQDVEFGSSSTNALLGYPVEKYGPYRQYLLAAFNETSAYFPESRVHIDGEPFYGASQVLCPSAISGNDDSISHDKLPFSMDIIENLPTFCFPAGGYVYPQSGTLKPEITNLVLTNLDGVRTYAVHLTFLQPYAAIQTTNDDGKVELKNVNLHSCPDGFSEDDKLIPVYAPICVCLVSSFPFFNTLKDCLSSLLAQINISGGEISDWRMIMKLATTLTLIPVPPAGPLAVRFSLFGNQHTIYPPSEADRRVIDIDIHLPLLIFTPELIVKIVTCLLTQQRMVFMSSSYSLLTIIIEAFFTYIDPIKYVHTYVPTLPNSLGDLLEAPGQFIMGVHRSLKGQLQLIRKQEETPNIVLVDIDKGCIDLGDDCHLPEMPDIVAQSLIVRLRKISPHFDLQLVSMPTMFTYKDLVQQRYALISDIQMEIRTTFLDMLVSLFGGIFSYMSVGKQYFDREAFLQSHNEDEREFFAEVVFTDAFRRFVEDRLERHELRDEFAVLGERVAQKRRSVDLTLIPLVFSRGRSSTSLSKIPKYEYFSIPTILEESVLTGNYYKLYCENLTSHLRSVGQKYIRLKASYKYLRGFAHIACDNPVEGLRDFHELYSSAPELFPKEFAANVVRNLDPLVLGQLQAQSFYKETITFRTFTSRLNFQMENAGRPQRDTPVDKSEFQKRWKPLKAAISSELVDWLFDILSPDGELIPHNMYNEFDKFYSSFERQPEVNEILGVKMQTSDRVVKVSSLISTEKGMGRLVLTVNNLYFIRDGAREELLITPLCDIKEIVKYQQNSVFFSVVKSLRIINSDKDVPSFYACLKEERDTWAMFLNELTAGHKSSITLRERNMVDMAVNNVMVVQALLQMNFNLEDTEDAFYFTKKNAIESQSISDDTKEALEIRLDPCLNDTSRTTVWSIAYVPGDPTLHEPSTIWVGMGSGAIVVYETEKWNCVSELRYAKSRISCLHLVGTKQIWAGSIDTVIYVIDTETRKSEQQLQRHTDFVSDIISYKPAVTECGTARLLVWSSSYNGQIVCWDPEVREAVCSTALPKIRTLSQIILVREKYLWCVTNDEIIVLDTSTDDWNILKRLVIRDTKQFQILLGCAFKVSEEHIWMGSKFGSSGIGNLHIWNTVTYTSKPAELGGEEQVCCMVTAYGSVWVGSKDGRITVMSTDGKTVEREFHVHEDMVKSMCETPEGHVISGSGSKEGKVCVWNAMSDFDIIDGRRKWVSRKSIAETRENYEVVPLINDMFSHLKSH